ncbi:piggyBac transposable element-derived protein 4-like [Schistocerca cancellata]|uniref:piggyBac transposable element-derived protein 4-like n=1 Tax=Schistocerca cancellata TaxID=274614 RepID=UPI002117A9A4|nr:piggyBac transposable element-derived protein 4-like [Schistocerca cancellata]
MYKKVKLTDDEIRNLLQSSDNEFSGELSESSSHETEDVVMEIPDQVVSDSSELDESEQEIQPTRRRSRPKAQIEQLAKDMVASSSMIWKRSPYVNQRRRSVANVMRTSKGTKPGLKPDTSGKAFLMYFDDNILDNILMCTNQKLGNLRESSEDIFTKNSKAFEREKIVSAIGILFNCGVHRQNKDSLHDIFSKVNFPMYQASFSEHRLRLLLKCLRFDDALTQAARKQIDKFAPIRDIRNMIVCKFPEFYNPSESVTVNEELVTFHGRCPFGLYIPTKPGKYGIEVNLLCDSDTKYCFAADLYAGKNHNSGPEIVRRLIEMSNLKQSGRNVTMDIKFTTVPLASDLLKEKITKVGSIRSDKRDVPTELRPVSLKKILCQEQSDLPLVMMPL